MLNGAKIKKPTESPDGACRRLKSLFRNASRSLYMYVTSRCRNCTLSVRDDFALTSRQSYTLWCWFTQLRRTITLSNLLTWIIFEPFYQKNLNILVPYTRTLYRQPYSQWSLYRGSDGGYGSLRNSNCIGGYDPLTKNFSTPLSWPSHFHTPKRNNMFCFHHSC